MRILLIAGHGAGDPGAVGCGYQEATETRKMATAVKPLLESYGANVTMYDQNKNAYSVLCYGGSLPLSGVDYVIEFHLNAGVGDTGGNGVTTGTEILVDQSEAGTTVEQEILSRICALGFKNRGVKRRNDLLVQNTVTNYGISHALIETCFIDDADDMKLYVAKFNQIAQAIADGVAVGFGLVEDTDTNVGNMEAKPMTEAEVRKIIQEEQTKKTYNTVDELPFGKETIQKLIDKGLLAGEGEGKLNLSYDLLRNLVVNDRAGLYGE